MTDAQLAELCLPPMENRTPVGPCLLLVHDTGVYLMSNGIPRYFDESGNKSYVVYAEHCHPDNDEEYRETSRELVGGDDFVETLPIPRSWRDACDQFETFEINFEGNVINAGFVDPVTSAATT